MKAIGLVEIGPRRDAVEEEGIEQRSIFGGEIGVDRVEGIGVVGAHIGRRLHAGEKHGNVPLLEPGKDAVERVACHRRADAAKRIVGAELEDDRVGILADRPVDPGEPVAGGVARDTGIGHGYVVAAIAQGSLQLRGERVRRDQGRSPRSGCRPARRSEAVRRWPAPRPVPRRRGRRQGAGSAPGFSHMRLLPQRA